MCAISARSSITRAPSPSRVRSSAVEYARQEPGGIAALRFIRGRGVGARRSHGLSGRAEAATPSLKSKFCSTLTIEHVKRSPCRRVEHVRDDLGCSPHLSSVVRSAFGDLVFPCRTECPDGPYSSKKTAALLGRFQSKFSQPGGRAGRMCRRQAHMKEAATDAA